MLDCSWVERKCIINPHALDVLDLIFFSPFWFGNWGFLCWGFGLGCWGFLLMGSGAWGVGPSGSFGVRLSINRSITLGKELCAHNDCKIRRLLNFAYIWKLSSVLKRRQHSIEFTFSFNQPIAVILILTLLFPFFVGRLHNLLGT